MGCGVGPDVACIWLWLWCRPAAVALIGPLAQEFPYATGVPLKRGKKKRPNLNAIITPRNMYF